MKTRKLNKEEQKLIGTVIERERRVIPIDVATAKVGYNACNNFTTATIFLEPGKVLVGTAKRSPKDNLNPVIGQQLAFRRALSSKALSY